MDEIEVEYIEFDLNEFLYQAAFPRDYDRSDIKPFEVEVKLPTDMAMSEDMINISMLQGGYRIKDSAPYLVKDGKWWIADMDNETNEIIIQYGDEKEQQGVQRIPCESADEAIKDISRLAGKKFEEGYLMGKRRRIYWEKIDTE